MEMLTFPRKVQVVERVRRSEAQNLADRVRRYVEKMPAAISGSGGHDATFAVARTLIHGFALPEAVAWPILCEYNARCQPPWSERELRHKLADAGKLTKPIKPRGHLLGSEDSPKTFFPAPPKPEVMPWPVKIKPLPSKGPQPGSAPSPKPEPPDDYPRRKEETERLLRESRPRTLAKDWPASDSEISVATVADDDPEARRIAGELVKLHRDGAIKGPDDPEAAFYAHLIHTFGATYLPAGTDDATPAGAPGSSPAMPSLAPERSTEPFLRQRSSPAMSSISPTRTASANLSNFTRRREQSANE